jgi:hypothetical protein
MDVGAYLGLAMPLDGLPGGIAPSESGAYGGTDEWDSVSHAR